MDQDARLTRGAVPTVLVTGFLGAGKTTVINRLIGHFAARLAPAGRLAVMINEFASIGLDGALVPDEVSSLGPGYRKIELNRGSISCACIRADFVRELKRLAAATNPDLLLVEATGIARVDDLYAMMGQEDLDGLIRIARTICVVDAAGFHKVEPTLEAVQIQARHADLFILNKTDRVDAARLDSTERLLARHNPSAPVCRARYGDIDFAAALGDGPDPAPVGPPRPESPGMAPLTAAPSAPTAAAPEYRSASVKVAGVFDRDRWRRLLGALGAIHLLRAKGVIVFPEGPRWFDVVDGEYSEREAPPALTRSEGSVLTFVARENLDALPALVRECITDRR